MSLLLVSNRVHSVSGGQHGGLVVALASALQQQGGTWIGWNGECSEERQRNTEPLLDSVKAHTHTFTLTQAEREAYYDRFSNQVLWPLLHQRTALIAYDRAALDGYLRVNDVFAGEVMRMARPGDVVWVHDYHLIGVAAALRRRGFAGRIGFFLHVPVPPAELLRRLPGHAALLGLLSEYDHIGLQTPGDVARLSAYRAAQWPDLCGPNIAAYPVGIDTAAFAALAAESVAESDVQELKKSTPRDRLVIGVDRLDYSKGLPERLRGFAAYLARPAAEAGMTLLQIATPTRSDVPSYVQLREEVERAIGTLNGAHAAAAHTPVRYLHQLVAQRVLAGFYRAAHIGLVTPLQDGMNLVAKEYVAAQDAADPGVLVLSEFAGAAAELAGGALFVNPHDADAIADALEQAHAMPLAERQRRWRAMMDTLLARDVHRWAADFLNALRHRPELRAA